MKLQNWVLELWSNYEIATDRFFHLRLPAPRPRRRRTPAQTPPGHPRVAPPPKTASAPLVCVAPLAAGDPPSSTRACASPSRQAAGHLWPPLPGQLAPSSPSPDSPSPSPWAYKRQNSSSFRAPEPCPPSTAPPWPASAGAPWTTPSTIPRLQSRPRMDSSQHADAPKPKRPFPTSPELAGAELP